MFRSVAVQGQYEGRMSSVGSKEAEASFIHSRLAPATDNDRLE